MLRNSKLTRFVSKPMKKFLFTYVLYVLSESQNFLGKRNKYFLQQKWFLTRNQPFFFFCILLRRQRIDIKEIKNCYFIKKLYKLEFFHYRILYYDNC